MNRSLRIALMNRSLRIALGSLLLAWVGARAAAQELGEPLCGDCQTTGRIHHEYNGKELELEAGATYCSVFMDREPDLLGLDWRVCPKCRTPSAQARARREFDEEYQLRAQWLKERREEVDKPAGASFEHIRTAHFQIAWDIPEIKVGRRVYRLHEAMHLYAERMEALYQQLLEIHGITERDVRSTVHRLYLVDRESTSRRVGNAVMDGGFANSYRKSLIGPGSKLLCYRNSKDFPRDEDFHEFLVHTVSHHLHNEIDQCNQWLAVRYGWVYEGLAHYLEIRNFGTPITWCSRETGGFQHWKGKNWEGNVKRAVIGGADPAFQDVIQKANDTLTPMEHQFAWSYIDYLMWLDPKKMPKLIGYMKGPQLPTRDALKKAYGLSIGQFVDGWKAFVLEEYSTKSVKGPRVRPPKDEQ